MLRKADNRKVNEKFVAIVLKVANSKYETYLTINYQISLDERKIF